MVISHSETRNPFLRLSYGITEGVNKMPFSGKLGITPLVKDAIKEKDIYVKQTRLLRAMGLLGVFIPLHLLQAGMGLQVLGKLPQEGFDLRSVFDGTGAALYTLANVGSSFAQTNILGRMIGKYGHNRELIQQREAADGKPTKEFLREKRKIARATTPDNEVYFSAKQTAIAGEFTLGGQLLFLGIYTGLI